MSNQKIVEEQVQEDDGLTFRVGPPVVHPTPVEVVPVPLVVPTARTEVKAETDDTEGTPVVPLGPKDGPPCKEPMKVVKLRVPASTHAQVVALMESFGCVNESQIYRHVLHVGLKHTKRPK